MKILLILSLMEESVWVMNFKMAKKFSKLRNATRKTIASVLVPVAIFAGTVKAKTKNETINLFSTEVTYTKDNDIFKLRPFIYTSPDNQRTDLMLGRKFDNFTLYGYWMADNKSRDWAGVRTDYNIKSLEGKLNTNLQFRFFLGLNEESANCIYFIPSVDYKLNNTFKVGILGYAKKSEGQDPFFYLGPSIDISLTEHISTLISYDKDLLGEGRLLFWSFNYKF